MQSNGSLRSGGGWGVWHRRVGIIAALFIFLIVATGFLLNHSDHLDLARRGLPPALAEIFYGDPIAAKRSRLQRPLGKDESIISIAGSLFLDGIDVGYCEQPFLGAAFLDVSSMGSVVVAVCNTSVLLLDESGLLERMDFLPAGTMQAGRIGNSVLVVRTATNLFEVNVADLELTLAKPGSDISWLEVEPVKSIAPEFHLERLLLDLHSGRLFGDVGVWIVDLLALLLVFMALSGSYLWFVTDRKR